MTSRPSADGRPHGQRRDGTLGLVGRTRDSVANLKAVPADAYPDWQAIYLDNVERLYRLMYGRVGNRPDAEDLTAEVFQAALVPLRTTASVGEVRAYLLTTARTVLATYWARRYGLQVTVIDPEADRPSMDDPPADTDAPQRVTQILDLLPERYRRILELRFLQSCSLREAARAMDITVGNAKVLQHRALRQAAKFSPDAR